MFNIHVRSIFRIFVPIDAPSNVTTVPFAQENQFGFQLQYSDPNESRQFVLRLFNVDDLHFVSSECFSLAKRKIHYSQPSTERANAIEGIFIRIKINHGFFDFRKSGMGGRTNVRLDVSCFNSAGELIQSGSSPIFLLYPKRRKARVGEDEDSACIAISWLDGNSNNNNININNKNITHSTDRFSSENDSPNYSFSNLPQEYANHYTIPLEGVHNSIESHEQHSENDSFEISNTHNAMQLYDELVPRTSSDQHYMVLHNGNAEVIGNFRALNFYKASDIRIKEDIRKLIDDYDCRDVLMQIDGVAYRFKQGVASSVNKRFVGFIAQQVESVVPDAVQLIDGILHVDYEALLPYLNESIKKNYKDISNIKTENQQLQKSIDILYTEFVKREAIVKYQHNPSSMFSDKAMPFKNKTETKVHQKRRPFWQWLLFILAAAALFISGAVAVYFVAYQNQSPDSPPTGGPPVARGFDRLTDKIALEEFFVATGGPYWMYNYGWLTALDMCSWDGLHCDTNGRVSEIRLSQYRLKGTIPESIGNLDRLVVLSLPQNDISGTLPESLFTLPSLVTLDLSYNRRLSGTIPSNVVPPKMKTLYLRRCNMTGSVPDWLSESSINDLMLQNNRFTGKLPVLNLGSLGRADFSSNQFEGSVPRIIGTMPGLNLANNNLTGTLEVWTRSFLAGTLILANNSLSGDFPFTNDQFKSIMTFDISNNEFTSVRMDVSMPPQLHECDATNNPFKCPIPQWLIMKCGATCK